MELTLTLKEPEVKQAVKEWVEKQGYNIHNMQDIKINLGIEDNERGSGSRPVLNNVEIKVTKVF